MGVRWKIYTNAFWIFIVIKRRQNNLWYNIGIMDQIHVCQIVWFYATKIKNFRSTTIDHADSDKIQWNVIVRCFVLHWIQSYLIQVKIYCMKILFIIRFRCIINCIAEIETYRDITLLTSRWHLFQLSEQADLYREPLHRDSRRDTLDAPNIDF